MEQFRTASAEQPSKSLGSDFYETPKKWSPGIQIEISPESWG